MTTFEYVAERPLAEGQNVRLFFVSSADPEALDRLCLYLAALPRMSGHLPGTVPDPLDLTSGSLLAGAQHLVAQVEGEIVGAVVVWRDAPANCYGYHMAHVAQIHVDLLPAWRGRGVGEALIAGLVEWAETQTDLKRLAFTTLSCNEWVIELLSEAGFVVEGRARASWLARTADGPVYLEQVSMGLLVDEIPQASAAKDLAAPAPAPPVETHDPTIPDVDCAPFFEGLVSQVRAFLPYEIREFEAEIKDNEAQLFVEGVPQGVLYAVAFRLASAEFDTPDMIEIGLHWRREPAFNEAQVARLETKLGALGKALGDKTLYADVWRKGWGRVALRLPYQPPDQAQAFMLAAQVAGFVQVLLPEARAAAD